MDNPLKPIVSNLMFDIDDYLTYIEDYGKPNPKYFNFVLKKMGIMQIFLLKSRIIKACAISDFIERILHSLKIKFIAEESSPLKQAGIIYLLNKIYFTDDVAIGLKLRLSGEEWGSFKAFLDNVKDDGDFINVCIMLYHLYTESFFRFTVKTKKLALDYGAPENALSNELIDTTKSKVFWKEIQDELQILQHTNVEELKQLAAIRDEAIKSFDDLLPEKASIDETLETFEAVQNAVKKLSVESPKKATRREMVQTCKDYLHHPPNDSTVAFRGLQIDEVNTNIDIEGITDEVTKKKRKRKNILVKKQTRSKKRRPQKSAKKPQDVLESGGSESESQKVNKKRMPYGFVTQKHMLENCAEKLKQFYE